MEGRPRHLYVQNYGLPEFLDSQDAQDIKMTALKRRFNIEDVNSLKSDSNRPGLCVSRMRDQEIHYVPTYDHN